MSEYTRYSADDIEPVGGIRYRLRRPLIWRIGNSMGPAYIVPEGRVFDVSIPRPMRLFLSPHNRRFLKAAALHDDMLCHGLCDQTVCDGGHPPELKADQVKWSREEAAGAFAAALKADGVGYWTRLIMHVGVIIWTTRRP